MYKKKEFINVLLLGSGTQLYAIVKDLAILGNKLFVVVSETGNYGDVSKYICKRFVCNKPIGSDGYKDYVKHIVLSECISVVLPLGDAQAEFLSKNKDELKKIIHLQAPDYDAFLKGYDKNQLMNLCQKNSYPHPTTIDLSKIDYQDKSCFDNFPFPGLLKPNCTTGGRGMTLINNYEELFDKYPDVHKNYGDCHLQRFVREGGKQVKIQLYVNEGGEIVASSVLDKVRWYPIKGGASSCAITTKNEEMVKICYNILRELSWVGFADFDTIEDPDTGKLLIMEINPRLPACIGASVFAGINWGEILINGALNKPQRTYYCKEGVTLRHFGFDILWFIHSPNRWKTKPSWFSLFGRNVFYQDFHFFDQKPFWVGTYHNIKKMSDPNFKKAKSGTSTF